MVFFQWYFLVVFREYIKKHRPFLILYALEHSNGDENGYVCLQGPRDVAPYVDMIVFAEENRARLELPRLGLDSQKTDVVLLHNSRIYPKECRTVLPEARTGDFFYGGRLRKKQNYGEWFLKEDIQKYEIDFYGLFGEFSKDEEVLSGKVTLEEFAIMDIFLQGTDTSAFFPRIFILWFSGRRLTREHGMPARTSCMTLWPVGFPS